MRPSLSVLAAFAPALLLSTAACSRLDDKSGPTPSASGAEKVVPAETDADEPEPADGTDGGPRHRRHKGHGHHGSEADAGPTPEAPDAEAPTTAMKFVIHKPTPEPIAPPKLRKMPALPALPALPPKDKLAKTPKLPKPPENGNCGEVWTGTEYVGVECVTTDVHAKHPKAAKVVVAYAKMKQPADKLPKMVDHRFELTEGAVRKQSGLDCTAFAFVAALDHSLSRWTGVPGNFSVMQIWARYHEQNALTAAEANDGYRVSKESEWPYDKAVAQSWKACGKDKPTHGDCGKPVDEAKLKEVDKHAVAEITQIEVLDGPDLELVKEKLAAGQDATLGLRLKSMATAGDPGAKYIAAQPAEKPGEKIGEHEVLLAGYAVLPGGTYYLIHNSWGPGWGDQGYAWIQEDMLKTAWVDHSMTIPDIEPLDLPSLKERARGRLSEKCEDGKLPDSITGLCAGKCAAGGPRHNNVCPDEKKNECPSGYVNLTGECVLSAPKGAGSEGKVKWQCGLSGCTYEMPKGELDCKENECQVSCPAPDFRLATMSKGLVCVE